MDFDKNQSAKIAIILFSQGIGGSEKRFTFLYNYLSNNGNYDYYLIINGYLYNRLRNAGLLNNSQNIYVVFNNGLMKFIDVPDIDIRLFGKNIAYPFNRIMNLIRGFALLFERSKLPQMEFDIAHFVFANYCESLIKYRSLILECQDTRLRYTLWKDKHYRKLLSIAKKVNIASNKIKLTLEELSKTKNDNKFIVLPCYSTDYSKCYSEKKEQNIVFCGNLKAIKNPILFLEALERIKNLNFKAFLFGEGGLKNQIDKKIRDFGLENKVVCMFHPNPPQILSKALIFVSIQSIDNYHSQALLEAMACGCAVIASDVGETWKLIDENVGFRVPLDSKEIADKIAFLLNNEETAIRLGKNAREKVMQEYSINTYSKYIDELYESVIMYSKNR
jgi:glycosyltransferase involved in cell wall biosynthesis